MPYEKLKNEQYHNFGGINTKVSPYASGPEEFLSLVNCDFNSPGALQKRQGSTQYLTSGVSGRVVGLYEFETLEGASYVVFGANTHLYYVVAHAPQIVTAGLQDSALLDFSTFVDRLFFANGANFMKWGGAGSSSGSTAYLFNLPVGPIATSLTTSGSSSSPAWANATMRWSFSWINDRGYFGPPGDPTVFSPTVTFEPDRISFNFAGSTYGGITVIAGSTIVYLGAPASYGIGFGTTQPIYNAGIGNTVPTGYTIVNAAVAWYRDTGPGTQRFRANQYIFWRSTSGVTYLLGDGSLFAGADTTSDPLTNFT